MDTTKWKVHGLEHGTAFEEAHVCFLNNANVLTCEPYNSDPYFVPHGYMVFLLCPAFIYSHVARRVHAFKLISSCATHELPHSTQVGKHIPADSPIRKSKTAQLEMKKRR